MSIALYCGGEEFEAADDVTLQWDGSGGKLVFAMLGREMARLDEAEAPMRARQVVEMKWGGERAFWGLVYDVAWDNEGLWRVEARDCKLWMGDMTYWGRSLQVARDKRFPRVKYAYSVSAVSAGWLVPWTVGAICQDVLNNMSGALAQDTTDAGIASPGLAEYFGAAIAEGVRHDYTNWASASHATVAAWVDGVTSGSSASKWKDLTIMPYGMQYDGETVAAAIEKVLKRYCPGWSWWVPPGTLVPEPVNVYGTAPETADTFAVGAAGPRVLIENVRRTVEGCYSRVIIVGQSASAEVSKLASGAMGMLVISGGEYLLGFIVPGSADISMQGFYQYADLQSQKYRRYEASCSGYDPETQKLQITKASTYSENPIVGDPVANGYYWNLESRCRYRTDGVWIHDTGYVEGEGTAYSELGLRRTLVLLDETVGDAVLVTPQPGNESTGKMVVVDRAGTVANPKEGRQMASAIIERVKNVRYAARMIVRGGPVLNPLRRVKVTSVPVYGDIVCVPASVTWKLSTGEREYTLGDSEYNPIEEQQLLNQLNWRDKANGRDRYLR